MKHFLAISTVLAMTFLSCSLNAQTISGAQTAPSMKSTAAVNPSSQQIEVIYFHFTRRCLTCNTVEANSKLAVNSLYADKVKTGEASFKSYNLDEAEGKAVADKHKIGGQALVVITNGKVTDITGQAFINAKDASKIQAEIKKAVDNSQAKK